MSAKEVAVEVRGLTKYFGSFCAVDHISFDVRRGEIFGFLGPNGAGKTTTIRMLLGLLRPTAGEATVLGYDIVRSRKRVHARVGYMSQLFTLYRDLSAEENICFYGQAYGLAGRRLRERKRQVLAMAGLSGRERELTGRLSGGWRQRLALGCALIHEPDLLFLDEPTAGVDPVSRREFWEMIYALSAQGKTIFVTTHYMDEAERCQRLAIISDARLIAIGSPEELKLVQMRGRVIEIACAQPEAALRVLTQAHLEGVEEIALYGAELHVVALDPAVKERVCGLLQEAGIAVQSAEWIMPSLEDVFISSVKARA